MRLCDSCQTGSATIQATWPDAQFDLCDGCAPPVGINVHLSRWTEPEEEGNQ